MATRLFDRSIRVSVQRTRPTATEQKFFVEPPAGLDVTELRVQFNIEKTLAKGPNSCELTVTNLAPATRAELQNKFAVVRIEAGYDGVLRHLFTGDLRYVNSKVDGPNWLTEMELGEGARAITRAKFNKMYKPGTQAIVAIRDAARAMNLVLPPNIDNLPALREQLSSGGAFSGLAGDELARLLAPYGLEWSVQNGVLQILADSGSVDTALEVSEHTGMIGSPELGKPDQKGRAPLTVKMLLYPELYPGRLISITSRAMSGTFKIHKLSHKGDTHGGDWTTEVEVRAQ